MSRATAKAPYDKGAGEPDSGYITPADPKTSVDVIYDDMEAAVASMAPRATLGNLLTANQATATDTDGTTTGFQPQVAGGTISSSTEQALSGTRSLKTVTPGSAGYEGWAVPYSLPVKKGVPVTVTMYVYPTTQVSYRFGMFYDSATIDSRNSFTAPANQWSLLQATAIPLADSNLVQIFCDTGDTAQAATWYTDQIGWWYAAGGRWAPPGTPIVHTGIRPNPANTAQVQVWNDITATWITV